jgi:hypothetical protein
MTEQKYSNTSQDARQGRNAVLKIPNSVKTECKIVQITRMYDAYFLSLASPSAVLTAVLPSRGGMYPSCFSMLLS